jgi:hypothetical protein
MTAMDKYYFDLALKELRAAMDNDSDKDEFVDLIYSLEKLRANPHIPAEALRALEEAHEIFMHHVRQEQEIALHAYAYGLTIGAYIASQEALPETDRLLTRVSQSKRGKRSGQIRRENRPWIEHAENLAKATRKQHSDYSQDKVATEIAAGWKLQRIECPGHGTLKQFIGALENEGKLPKRSTKQKS